MTSVLAGMRRQRAVIGIVVLCLAAIVLLSLVSAHSAGRTEALDPDNPHPAGAQALARVLAQHGVDVSVVRRAKALDDARLDRDTTLVVTSTANLGRSTALRLRKRAQDAAALVLAAPGPELTDTLDLPVEPAAVETRSSRSARCDDDLLSGLRIDADAGVGYRAAAGADVTTCFADDAARPVSLVARVDAATTTYAVGADSVLSNRRIKRSDNAAAALRLLGQHERLVWYVPDYLDVPAGDTGSGAAQLPRGLAPALWLVAAALLATILWRGRRLGPLVAERLPVVVKAVESTQGRGRLYRRVRDQQHAADVLRSATGRRLLTRLHLPARTDAGRLVHVVAETTGVDVGVVHELLVSRPVTDDKALTRLAADLAALEREVHDA